MRGDGVKNDAVATGEVILLESEFEFEFTFKDESEFASAVMGHGGTGGCAGFIVNF